MLICQVDWPLDTNDQMSWKRLPTYFLNFPLKLLPLSEGQQKLYEQTGHLTELAFRTVPKAGKVRGLNLAESPVSIPRSRVIISDVWLSGTENMQEVLQLLT